MLYRECREMSIGDQVALNARRFHQLAQDLGVLVPRRRDPRRLTLKPCDHLSPRILHGLRLLKRPGVGYDSKEGEQCGPW